MRPTSCFGVRNLHILTDSTESDTSDRKTLEYYLVELAGPTLPISMLKAWVGIVLLAEDDWFYASPTPSAPPSQNFGTSMAVWKEHKGAVADAGGYRMLPINGEYQCLALDFHFCCFDLSSKRSGVKGCVVNGRFLQPSVGRGPCCLQNC